jgi:hypothetical protein
MYLDLRVESVWTELAAVWKLVGVLGIWDR